MFKDKIYNKIWNIKFLFLHRELSKYKGNNKLRFILGAGRSGTSWISQVLAASSTKMRFFSEPLFRINPRLYFSKKRDHTALPYCKNLPANHALLKVYDSLTIQNYDWGKLFEKFLEKKLLRNDKNFEICLVKEVHALLASESLVKFLKCPIVFIGRDPIAVVDSNLFNQGKNAQVWLNEYDYINDDNFLDIYFVNEKNNIKKYFKKISKYKGLDKIIFEKVLTVAIFRKMFKKISKKYENVIYFDYEKICSDPKIYFREIADFLNIKYCDKVDTFLENTMKEKKDSSQNAFSIYRNTVAQIDKPLKFINKEQLVIAEQIIKECNLY